MDYYIPKRRIPVTLWSSELHGAGGQIFLDLDSTGNRHQTILEKLNESSPFLPVAMGDEGRIHLFNRRRLSRVVPGVRCSRATSSLADSSPGARSAPISS